MDFISIEKGENLFWLGRYVERVYRTLNYLEGLYDVLIDTDETAYKEFCVALNIPDVYDEITNLPEGYAEDVSKRIEWPEYISFTYHNSNEENDQGIIFDYTYMSQGGVADFVTEDSETISVTVNGMKGQLFLAKDWKNTRSTLTWIDTDNNIQFTLMAALNETDILHMAESVSLLKTEK